MSDPGWDIPGIPREPSPGAGAPASSAVPTAAASPAESPPSRRHKSGRRARAGSVSAASGLSAGAFARLTQGGSPAPASSQDSADGSVNAASPGPASTACAGTTADGAGSAGTTAATAGADSAAARTAPVDAAGAGAVANGVLPDSPAQALAFVAAGLDFLAHDNPVE